jgi:hypothetical protein
MYIPVLINHGNDKIQRYQDFMRCKKSLEYHIRRKQSKLHLNDNDHSTFFNRSIRSNLNYEFDQILNVEAFETDEDMKDIEYGHCQSQNSDATNTNRSVTDNHKKNKKTFRFENQSNASSNMFKPIIIYKHLRKKYLDEREKQKQNKLFEILTHDQLKNIED